MLFEEDKKNIPKLEPNIYKLAEKKDPPYKFLHEDIEKYTYNKYTSLSFWVDTISLITFSLFSIVMIPKILNKCLNSNITGTPSIYSKF